MTFVLGAFHLTDAKKLVAQFVYFLEAHFATNRPGCSVVGAKCPLSATQQRLFVTLKAIVAAHYTILLGISVEQFIVIEENSIKRNKARASLAKVDFLIVDSEFSPIVAIDMCAKSTLSKAEQLNLGHKEQLLLKAGLQLLVIQPAESYCIEDLCAILPKRLFHSCGAIPKKPWARFPYHARFNPRRKSPNTIS